MNDSKWALKCEGKELLKKSMHGIWMFKTPLLLWAPVTHKTHQPPPSSCLVSHVGFITCDTWTNIRTSWGWRVLKLEYCDGVSYPHNLKEINKYDNQVPTSEGNRKPMEGSQEAPPTSTSFMWVTCTLERTGTATLCTLLCQMLLRINQS